MMVLLDLLSVLFLVVGSFFAVIGGVGIVRLPEFFSRMHGAGITDTMGAGMIMVGLMFQQVVRGGDHLVIVKLLMILFFLLITSPSSCHALAKAAMTHGLSPELDAKTQQAGGRKK